MNYNVAATITAMVRFGFDVAITSISEKDVLIHVMTNNPIWVKTQMEAIANTYECDHTFYMDEDRVHGYLYQY